MISSTPLCSEEGIKYTTLECEALVEQQRPISLKLVFGSIAIATAMVTFWFAPEASSSLFVAPRIAAVPRVSAVMWATPAEAPQEVNEEAISEKVAEAVAEEEEKVDYKEKYWGVKSYYPKLSDTATENKKWFIVDATGMRLGRMASEIAQVLRGKRNPMFHPAMDLGDYVIVVNAEKVIVSGRKAEQKLYRRHTTGRPGSMKTETFAQLQHRLPERIIHHAVKGMMPKGSLGRLQLTHLRVFKGPDHPHQAQNPKPFQFVDPRVSEPLKKR
eukprot:EG_transcript_18309